MPERHGEQIVESTTEARQGVTGNNVRYVLVWSIGGVIVAFVIVYFLFSGERRGKPLVMSRNFP
jgi:hypothetical protein